MTCLTIVVIEEKKLTTATSKTHRYSVIHINKPGLKGKEQETPSSCWTGDFHPPVFCLELEEPPCSTLAFFFLEAEESEERVGRFSTAGVERARFLNSSRSLSKLGSMILPRGKGEKKVSASPKYLGAEATVYHGIRRVRWEPQGPTTESNSALHRTRQEPHSGPGSVVQAPRELWQGWCRDHIPGEQFISCSLLLFPSADFSNSVKASVHYRNLKERARECRTGIEESGTSLTRHGQRQDGTKWHRRGRATGNQRPEDAGASPPL